MRFLIRELPYEKPIAAGKLRYLYDGEPTGAVESWRLTAAVEGYRFLRVDLDARQAASGNSYLFHLTLNPAGRPERLSFRIWGPGRKVGGNVLLDERSVAVARTLPGEERVESEVQVAPGYAFWFPASTGLSLLATMPEGELTAVMLGYDDALTLHVMPAELACGEPETRHVAGQERPVQPLTIRWADTPTEAYAQWRRIWLDEHDWPVEMERQDGLRAVSAQYMRYT